MRLQAEIWVGAFLVAIAIATASQTQLSRAAPLQLQKQRLVSAAIASVAPAGCVKTGARLTITGTNFGDPKSTGYSLGVQVGSNPIVPVTDPGCLTAPGCLWSSTSIAFTFPAVPGLATESLFSLGIVSGRAFVAKKELKTCAAAPLQFQRAKTDLPVKQPTRFPVETPTITAEAPKISSPLLRKSPGTTLAKALTKRTARVAGTSARIKNFNAKKLPAHKGLGAGMTLDDPGAQPADSGLPPAITSVSPLDCVNAEDLAIAYGDNLGASRQSAGFSIDIQIDGGTPSPIKDSDWSPTSVGFIVPPEAEAAGWFVLGITFESEFYPQQFVGFCNASGGMADYDYGDYGSQDYGGFPGSEESPAAGPKGARLLAAGGVNIQVQPPPAPAEADPEQLPQPGNRAVGGKLLAMKSLARRGLYKLNRECALYDPQCPCCRKDNSVCLEKESNSEAGDSTWVVRWKNGAKSADGQGLYTARSAEDDLEAVTELQCEPAVSGAEGSAGLATLICR